MVTKGKKSSIKKETTQEVVTKKSTKSGAKKAPAKVAKAKSTTVKKTATKKNAVKSVAKKTTSKKKIVKAKAVKTTTAPKAKKTTAKKAPTKKKVAKRTKTIWEKTVPPESCFYTFNNKKLNSILALIKELEDMEEHVYHHHVSYQNNDFANWIEGVFELTELAKEIRESHTRDETQLLLLKFVINNA